MLILKHVSCECDFTYGRFVKSDAKLHSYTPEKREFFMSFYNKQIM